MARALSLIILCLILSGNLLFPFSFELLFLQIGLYLFAGALINLICQELNFKLLFFWFPAIWSERVLDWIK